MANTDKERAAIEKVIETNKICAKKRGKIRLFSKWIPETSIPKVFPLKYT